MAHARVRARFKVRFAQTEAATSAPATRSAADARHKAAARAQAPERRSALVQGISHSPRDTNLLVRAVTLNGAPTSIRPLLLALLALSICLLGTASLPQAMLPTGPVAGGVVRARIYLAAAGIWLLAVVVFVTLVS